MYYDNKKDKYSKATLNFDYLNVSTSQWKKDKNAFEINIKGITKGESFIFKIKEQNEKDGGTIDEWLPALY